MFGWEGSPTKIDYSKKGTLIVTSLLVDPELIAGFCSANKSAPRSHDKNEVRRFEMALNLDDKGGGNWGFRTVRGTELFERTSVCYFLKGQGRAGGHGPPE